MNYLVLEGHQDVAEMFQLESGTERTSISAIFDNSSIQRIHVMTHLFSPQCLPMVLSLCLFLSLP